MEASDGRKGAGVGGRDMEDTGGEGSSETLGGRGSSATSKGIDRNVRVNGVLSKQLFIFPRWKIYQGRREK